MERLLWHIIAGILSIFLAVRFIPGVSLNIIPGESYFLGIELNQIWQLFIVLGGILGIFNFFIKPILDIITLPLKILTLGLFTIILNMMIIKGLDIIFKEFQIAGLVPLFLTTLIVWLTNLLLGVKRK